MWRKAIRRLLQIALVAAALWAFGIELQRALVPRPSAARRAVGPHRWNLRTSSVGELRDFLADVDVELPAGSIVSVAARPLPDAQEFFLYLWHAYYLPRHDLLRASQSWTWKRADFLLTWGGSPQELGIESAVLDSQEPLLRHASGELYRLRRP